jgi:hypothetical protein
MRGQGGGVIGGFAVLPPHPPGAVAPGPSLSSKGGEGLFCEFLRSAMFRNVPGNTEISHFLILPDLQC